jgi:hypothetical protein
MPEDRNMTRASIYYDSELNNNRQNNLKTIKEEDVHNSTWLPA